eukprot:1228908-Heterocapsa_arctica.AAC.1
MVRKAHADHEPDQISYRMGIGHHRDPGKIDPKSQVLGEVCHHGGIDCQTISRSHLQHTGHHLWLSRG